MIMGKPYHSLSFREWERIHNREKHPESVHIIFSIGPMADTKAW